MTTPADFKTLFDFYYSTFKLLYSEVQTSNEMPVEVLFEINAAFDHISRHWSYGEQEQVVAEKALSHLKRGCFDAFKLKVKQIRDEYDELKRIDTSIIDNGDFDRGMIVLFDEIRREATEARRVEGDTRPDTPAPAFDLWIRVYEKCIRFHEEFYLHKSVEWARKKHARSRWFERIDRLWVGICAGLVAGQIIPWVFRHFVR
ncbi:MAG: hypothetical protein PHU85_04465 [Phycisphaerae bacterium]|nr:hypothetical protein [Phycisphaerae bacterium]